MIIIGPEMSVSWRILSTDRFCYLETIEIINNCIPQEESQTFSRRKLFERRINFKFDASFNEAKYHVINHFEQHYLNWLISDSKGNVTRAAEIAQKERRALGKLLKKHDIDPYSVSPQLSSVIQRL